MTPPILRTALAAALVATTFSGVAVAQESSNVIGTFGDWTSFQGDSPKECWSVSPPKKSVATREGKPVEVDRGDIRLYIAYRPGQAGELSFSGGYPFASGSTVDLAIGGSTFKLFTEGESAWTGSPDDDVKVISALRGGSDAVATGRSARGTTTVDNFSLAGITKATDAAKKACAK